MAWNTITHSCGHTEDHQLYGPGRNREWRAKCMAAEPCSSCRAEALAAENRQAAQSNAASGLPALTGTEKQIAWAETIRHAKLDTAGKALSGELTGAHLSAFWGDADLTDPDLPFVVDALQAQTSASWWIDHRDLKVSAILFELADKLLPTRPTDLPPAAIDARVESTLRPAEEITPVVTEIRPLDGRIDVILPERHEAFRTLVKALGYTWNGTTWTRSIDGCSGPVADRAAELGNRLLAAGFPVCIHDPLIRQWAIDGTFTPEQRRWVKLLVSGEHAGKIFITWGKDDDCYEAAKALPGARYVKPGIAVPADRYEAIFDFALAHGFSIGAKATEALDAARAAYERAVIATPAKAPKVAKGPGTKPAADGAIDPALMDDDSGSEFAMLHGDSQS